MPVLAGSYAPYTGRMRAAALATLLIFAALAVQMDDSDPAAGLLVAAPFALPYLLILFGTKRKDALAWARVCGAVVFVISLWFTAVMIALIGERPPLFLTNALAFAVLAVAQGFLWQSARQMWRVQVEEGKLPPGMGWARVVPTLYWTFFLVLAAIALPSLLRSRTAANEASAVGSMRTMHTALATYNAQHHSYPEGVSAMNDLLDPQLACAQPPCQKSGYHFTYTLLPPDASGARYTISARPVKHGNTGFRSFFTDHTGVIRFTRDDRPATAKDEPLM